MTVSHPTACRRCISQNITCAPLRYERELVHCILARFHTLFLDICPLTSSICWGRREYRIYGIDSLKKLLIFSLAFRFFIFIFYFLKKGLDGV